MTVRNLEYLMNPSSIALIGASERPSTVGEVLTRNILGSKLKTDVYLVNPHYESLAGVPCYPDVASLPKAPDMAVIATPRESVVSLVEELGQKGTRAAVVITAGFAEGGDEEGRKLHAQVLDAARPFLLRVVGPNCLGIMLPWAGLNASMAHIMHPRAGNIAFVAQSGAVQTSVLDWAISHGIGFSHFISLGDMADVDFGDMLDYLATDYRSRAILLYMETVTHARKFMSAARAAARVKPVIVLKAGRSREGAAAAARHTGAVAGNDAVCEAAFRRAGMLRVYEMQALFDAVETLAMMDEPVRGDRLAILTNGGGVGVIATDALIQRGGHLAELSPKVIDKLDAVLPPTWSRGNPVDIMSDASAERYAQALEVIFEDQKIDAVLALNCPIAVISGSDAATAVIDTYKRRSKKPKKPVLLTCWLGEQAASEARALFAQNRIPSYKTPTDAVRAFMHMVHYQKNQEMLMQTPPSIPESFSPDIARALGVVEAALAQDQQWLSETDAKSILLAYGIPVVPCLSAAPPEEAARAAAELGSTVAPRIVSPDSPMIRRSRGCELMVGMRVDAQFGPVIVFGYGGEPDAHTRGRAVALPPLNLHLAREAVHQARIRRFLNGPDGRTGADVDDIALILVKVSQLICDLAEIAELSINPLIASESGVSALDVRMRIARSFIPASERLAIRPYPKELEESIPLQDGPVLRLRPIRPEDEPGFLKVFESLSLEERRMRFLHPMQELSHREAGRLTQIDYDREMALVLAGKTDPQTGAEELYGSVRIMSDPDNERAEYAILVRSGFGGKGLGKMLMQRIIGYARSRGIKEIFGQVLCENIPMLKVCERLGFTSRRDPEDPGVMVVSLRL